MSSLSRVQPDTAGLAASQPPGTPPPELELGGVALVMDQSGLIVAAEPVCTALFQWDPAELTGQPLEVLLTAGADKIREQLVPDQRATAPDTEPQPRLFALAQRKDGTSFAVAVSLELQAGFWWAVAFHDVNSAPAAQSDTRAVGIPPSGSTSRRSRAQVAAPLSLENIPDLFYRAPAETESQPQSPATGAAAAPEPAVPAARMHLSQEPPAAGASPAEPASADSDTRVHELEQSLSQRAAELKRTRAHVQQQDEQLHAASSTAQQATAALEQETARRAELEAELAQARQAGDELNQQLTAEQQTRAESEARLQEMEQRLSQTVEDFKSAQAQNAQPTAPSPTASEDDPVLQGQLLELETRLRTAVSSLARTTAELETERGEHRRSEQRAASLAARMQQLHVELKDHLASEQIDHQRLAELEHQIHEQGQQNDLTVAKLQSALQLEQCERKRLEAELHRSRFLSTDSARAVRAQVNGLRRQLQPSVESLHQAACRVLQLQLSDEQKQLLQTMLESTLLLQTSLQESPES